VGECGGRTEYNNAQLVNWLATAPEFQPPVCCY